jgi:hypothetical protein
MTTPETQFPDVDTHPADTPTVIAEALVVNPGDTLIIRVPADTGRHAAEVLKAEMRQHLPGTVVIVLPAEQLAVVRGPKLDNPARPLVDLPDGGDNTAPRPAFPRAPLPKSMPIPQPALTIDTTDGQEHKA